MKILHLEDNLQDANLIREIIKAEWPDCEIRLVSSRFAYEGELHLGRHDLILSDFTMAAFSGLEALQLAKERAPEIPFIFLSGTIGEDRAIEALQAGADDYVLKDRMKRLVTAIQRVLRESEEHKKRLRAERLAREQAEMLNQAREAIIITNLKNEILYWNAGAERLYGWTSAEVLGRTATQLFANEKELGRLQSVWETTLTGGAWHGEVHLYHRLGSLRIVDLRQTLICDETGKAKAQLSISSDITEQKQLEEQLLRAQRLENIGLLAAGIAHDLNNMLAPIVMAAPLLREFVSDPSGLRVLSTLEHCADRGAGLVRQILAFAQGVNGEHQLVQVKHLLRDLTLFIPATFPKNIELEDHIPNDLWPINANATQIHQVLLNLCVNARDAMPKGGRLILRAENCLLEESAARAMEGARAGAFLVLHVEDTGTGIAPAVLAHMWEPFITTKEPGKGTGLGLSTARGIIKNHGGFVQLQTQVDRGTTFRIYLPAADTGAGVPVPAAVPLAPMGNGELILVVDDEKNIRDMIAVLLTRQRYRVLVAADGVEAVILFAQQANDIRLVVSDIQMPNLDGPTMVRLLKRINPAIKLLVVSGVASTGVAKAAREAGDFDAPLLNKPFMPEVLLAKVHELLHASPPDAT